MAVKAKASITLVRVNDGAAGNGIKSITEHYQVSSSNTTPPMSWLTTVPVMTITDRYLWNYETITYTNGTTTDSAKRVIGVYGDTGQSGQNGATGNGIKSITNYYLATASNSGVTTASSGWTTTAQTVSSSKKYLWNYEIITYTNGSTTKTTPCIIGTYGDKGDPGSQGKGVLKTEVYYYLSTSNATQTGGSWTTSPPAWIDGKYYWQKIKTTFTDNTTSESKPVCITGGKGSTGGTGSPGQGVSSITTEFYLSTSKTSQTGGSWTMSMPTWSQGKYLWTRSKIIYINPSKTVYTAPVCDSSWEAVNEVRPGSRNLLRNGDFSKTCQIEAYTTSKHDSLYPVLWYSYNPGISNPTTSFHAHVDTKTFGYNTIVYDERDGTRNWKGISLNSINMGDIKQVDKNYTISMDVYATGEKCTIYGGFHYKKKGGDGSNGFWSGMYYIEPEVTNKWIRMSERVPLNEDIDLSQTYSFYIYGYGFGSNSAVYIKNVSLTAGNVMSDWTPAPEDVDENIHEVENSLHKNIEKQATNILSKCEHIILEALTTYTKEQDFSSFKETVSSQLKLMSDQMTLNFKKTTQEISSVNTDLQNKFNTITKYFTFDINGLTIGQNESPYKVKIDNDRYSMSVNDVDVMWIANGKVYTPEIEVTKAFKLFDYMIDQDSQGNVNMEYIGGK